MGTLAAPTDWTWLWVDSDSGEGTSKGPSTTRSVRLVTLPSVSSQRPGLDDMRCVAERFTVLGSAGTFVTDDHDSGGDYDYSVNRIAPPLGRLADGKVALSTNAQIVAGSGGVSTGYLPDLRAAGLRVIECQLSADIDWLPGSTLIF